MNYAAVRAQINDLPATFTPTGNPYAQVAAARAAALAVFTNGSDATEQQVQQFSNAIDGWIDVWGLLFGIPRNTNEGNVPYAIRIVETVLAWVGTLPALQAWTTLFAPGGSVAENGSGLGYTITLPGAMTATQAAAFVASLGRIRPAGVPFVVVGGGLGLYLDAEAFLGKGVVFGSYLTGYTTPGTFNLNATTNSSQPLIPTLFLSDPNLNPGTSQWPNFSVNSPYIPGTVVSGVA
jgi:hypothetical protein